MRSNTPNGRAGRLALSLGTCAVFALTAITLSVGSPAGAQDVGGELSFHDVVNGTLGLETSNLITVDVPVIFAAPVSAEIDLNGRAVILDLLPHSHRSDLYQVLHYGENGQLVEAAPSPLNTLKGEIRDMPGSVVVGGMMADGLHLKIMEPSGRTTWLEALGGLVDGAAANQYVTYSSDDVIPNGGTCGTTELLAAPGREKFKMRDASTPLEGGEPECTQLAADTDFEFFQDFGSVSACENRINLVISTMNNQYETQVGISHLITTIIVRDSSNDPYSSNEAGVLLDQFRAEWLANQNGVVRDIAHMFSGRNFNGGTIGIAWLGVICSTNLGYGLVQHDFNLSCMTDLSAHELGHNWNADHCNCINNTMHSFQASCANSFHPTFTQPDIINFRNTRTCLSPCPDPGPSNDDCGNAQPVPPGDTPFTNVGADQDGPNEPVGCNSNQTTFPADIWFTHQVQCDGIMTVSVCNANFNTKLAVYPLGACPPIAGTYIACDDNTCGLQTEVQFAASAGDLIRIRVAGWNNEQGDGVLFLGCDPVGNPCPADIDNSGTVATGDLLALLANWGGNGDGADLAEPLNVVDTADLLVLLAEWGPCDP